MHLSTWHRLLLQYSNDFFISHISKAHPQHRFAMPGDLNLKKSWHPGLHKNQAVVHAKEQEALEERRRIQERQKEIKQQRERDELQKLQEMATGKKRVQKVEWMYQDPTAVASSSKQAFNDKKVDANSTDDYLLGKRRIDSIVKQKGDLEAFDDSLDRFQPKTGEPAAAENVHKVVKNDPMVAVRQKGRELGYTDEANESERRSRRERSRSRERERRRPRRKREDSRDRRNRRDHEREGDRRRRRRDGTRRRARDRSQSVSDEERGYGRDDRRSSRDDRDRREERDRRSERGRDRDRSRDRYRDRSRSKDRYRDRARDRDRDRDRDQDRNRDRDRLRDRSTDQLRDRSKEERSRDLSRERLRSRRDEAERRSDRSGRSSRSSRDDRSRSRDPEGDRSYRSRSRERERVSGGKAEDDGVEDSGNGRSLDVNASDGNSSRGYRADNEMSPSGSPVLRTQRSKRDTYRPGDKDEDAKRVSQRKEKEKEVDALPKGLQQMRAKLLASKKGAGGGSAQAPTSAPRKEPSSTSSSSPGDKAATDAKLTDRLARLKAMQDDAKALEEERDERLASKTKHEEAERLRDALLRQKSSQLGRSEFARDEERRDLV